MVFAVTSRQPDGSRKVDYVEAADKAALWPILKARGIRSIRVAEHKGKTPTDSSQGAGRAPSTVRGVVAGLIAVVLAGACAWFFMGDGRRPPRPQKAADSKAIPVRQAKARRIGAAAVTNAVRRQAVPAAEDAGAETAAATNAPAETVAGTKAPEKVADNYRPLFTNGVEQLLDMLTPSDPGAVIPPPPIITDEFMAGELKAALDRVSAASEDDTEESIGRKLAIEDRKSEFIELNKAGKVGISDYMNAVREQHNENLQVLSEARRLDEELYNDAAVSDADYRKNREEINRALTERGLPKLETRGE